jgi:hypothetical protein
MSLFGSIRQSPRFHSDRKEIAMSRMSFCRAVVITATLVLGAMALSPGMAAANERPFKAMLAGNAHLSPTDDPCVLRNDETAEGEATHLGRFTWVSVEFADFCTIPGGVAVIGSFTMTAANGDELSGEYTTVGLFDEAGNLIIHGTYEFNGGTGRFSDASGNGDIDAIGLLTPGLPVEGTLNGMIDY